MDITGDGSQDLKQENCAGHKIPHCRCTWGADPSAVNSVSSLDFGLEARNNRFCLQPCL